MCDIEIHALVDALLAGDQARSVAEAKSLCASGVTVERIVVEGVGKAVEHLDGKCTLDQFNLLEIMLVGRAVMSVVRELIPQGEIPAAHRGTVLLASLEGDVHDLGKNILKMVLSGKGYHVIDCGKDCPLDRLVNEAELQEADAVCISGLITTVIPQVRRVRELLAGRGLGHVRIAAGGAALKQASPESLNVDFVAQTAFDCFHFLESAVGG